MSKIKYLKTIKATFRNISDDKNEERGFEREQFSACIHA